MAKCHNPTRSEVVEEQINELIGAESLADTPFSRVFHEARTARSMYSGVTCQVRVREGEIETSDPVKTRPGEHLRGTDSWDALISLPVVQFMTTGTATDEITRQLRALQRGYQTQESESEGDR